MIHIAHIINPVTVDESSDLHTAQPVTFETMRMAKEFAESCWSPYRKYSVDQLTIDQLAAYYPEDEGIVPSHMIRTEPLRRSLQDFSVGGSNRRLPLIKDILERMYNESSAQYLVYTNVDIALVPHFYLTVAGIIREGYDGFIINRRTIPKTYSSTRQIKLMFGQLGEPHPGCDCFVFKRELYPRFLLGDVVIGCYFFGLALRTNLVAFASPFKHFKELHATFHIGNDQVWKKHLRDGLHNKNQLAHIFPTILDSSYLVNKEATMELHQAFKGRSRQLMNKIYLGEPL